MARPWQEHVVKYDLVGRFVQENIGMILNLQEVSQSQLSPGTCMLMAHDCASNHVGICSIIHSLTMKVGVQHTAVS